MAPMAQLGMACAAFVGTHFLLSHPLRAPMVKAMGTAVFQGVYSLVALATFGWIIWAFRAVPAQTPSYLPGDTAWAVASVAMLLASILLVGSFIGNPALPAPNAMAAASGPARGVYAITRHPMMWSFAIWALVHILLWPTPANHAVATAILMLAIGGSWGQDFKKAKLLGDRWGEWQAKTGFVPFSAQIAGRVGWGAALPAWPVLVGGTALWLAVTWAHAPLGSRMAAGIWRWL